jgi:hypothetical protein
MKKEEKKMNNIYQIKTSSNGRNVLIIKGFLSIDNIKELNAEDFDVIYVEDFNQSHYDLSYQLQHMSPFHSLKCHLKPCFLASTLKNRVLHLEPLIDGFATTWDDKDINKRVDEIYENLALIDTLDISEVKSNNYMYFLKLCKYAISRGIFTFTLSVEDAYAQGYTKLFVAKQNNFTLNMRDDFIRFNHVLVELGYAKLKKFIERIHVCPHCSSSRLFYMEACPKCDSSHLKEEPMLHHFRCANISPESSYAYDGELRCPKCHHFLRHIGVDYDRPSNVYTCLECSHTFIHTRMKVYCSSCKKTLRPSKLLAYDIYSYEFTPEGILALSSNEAVIAVSKDIWAGYSNFESFLSQIRLFSYSHEKGETIIIYRFKVEGHNVNNDSIMQIVSDLHKRYHYNNLSYKGNYIFMAIKVPINIANESWEHMKEDYEDILKIIDLKYAGIILTEQVYLSQEKEENSNAFIKRICNVNL